MARYSWIRNIFGLASENTQEKNKKTEEQKIASEDRSIQMINAKRRIVGSMSTVTDNTFRMESSESKNIYSITFYRKNVVVPIGVVNINMDNHGKELTLSMEDIHASLPIEKVNDFVKIMKEAIREQKSKYVR